MAHGTERIDGDAAQGYVAGVAELVLYVGRHEYGVSGLYRILGVLHPEDSLALDDVRLVFPGMYVLSARSARRMLYPEHYIVRHAVFGTENGVSPAFYVFITGSIIILNLWIKFAINQSWISKSWAIAIGGLPSQTPFRLR